jgi:hypothetical protein
MQKNVKNAVFARRHARQKQSPGRKRRPRPLIWESVFGADLVFRRVSLKRLSEENSKSEARNSKQARMFK